MTKWIHCVEEILHYRLEPENAVDSIYIDDTVSEKLVGHVPASLSKSVLHFLSLPSSALHCKVKGEG